MGRQFVTSAVVGLLAGGAGGGLTTMGASLGWTSFDSAWPVLTTCAVLAALIHHTKQSVTGLIDNRIHTMRNRVERVRRDVGDIHGLVRLGPYTQSLPLSMGGGWALTGDSAALLARETLARKPETILELGSGVSTIILGQILKKRGHGHLLSIDHDPAWANQTRQYVELLELEDVVSVVEAPLKNITVGEHSYEWYDLPASSLDRLGPIDLLLVDGPPQAKDAPQAARYPAFPVLRNRLSQKAIIFVDDANRVAESEMIRRWMEEDPNWRSRRFDTVDGVCLLTRDT